MDTIRFRWLHLLSAGLSILLLAGTAQGQTLAELRSQLNQDLGDLHFAKSFTGLITISDEVELSSARFDINADTDTDLTVITLPFQTAIPFEDDALIKALHIEGALGFAQAEQSNADIYGGAVPAAATSVKTDWLTYSGLIGAGLDFKITDNLTLTPIVNVGLAYLRNETDYAGPGAGLTAALADGIAFNWDAWAISAGVAGRADYMVPLSDRLTLEAILRYDIRRTESFSTENSAQDFSTTSQFLTARVDLTGPTGYTLQGNALNWRSTLGYRTYIEGDLYGTSHLVQIGGALELTGDLPLDATLALNAAVFVGDNITGWTIGLSVGF